MSLREKRRPSFICMEGLRHHLYIHVDPAARQLLYIGRSCSEKRSRDFTDRGHMHRAKLNGLLARGFTRAQIVHIVARDLDFLTADRIEAALVKALRPPCNIAGNPDYDWFGNRIAEPPP